MDNRAYTGVLDGAAGAIPEPIGADLEPAAAIEAALDRLESIAAGASWSVFLLEHDRLWAVSQRGYAMVPDGLALDSGVVARGVRTGEPQFVEAVSADPDYVPGRRGMASEIVVPIASNGEVVGALNLEAEFPLPESLVDALTPVAATLAPPLAALRAAPALDLSSLARLFVHMSSLRDPDAIAGLAARSLAHLLGLAACEIWLREGDGSGAAAGWSRDGASRPFEAGLREMLEERVARAAIFDLLDVSELGLAEVAGGCRTLVWLPLRANGVEIGVLVGAAPGELVFPRPQSEAAALVAAQSAASIDAALSLSRARRTAATDPLTGLLNRRGFGDVLEAALEDAAATRRPLSLCVLDCDDFKDINDRGGHERGDRVLVELAELTAHTLRDDDRGARLGGDEFGVLLAHTDAESALARAEELRVVLSRGMTEAGTTLNVSIGVATYPFDGGTASQLMRAADQALYMAKSSGKDLVVAFRDLGELTRRGAGARRSDRRAAGRRSVRRGAEAGIDAVVAESSPRDVFYVLCRSLTAALSATAASSSLVIGDDRLIDVASYALRDVDMGANSAYLLDDFPLTRKVLDRLEPVTMSFLDDRIDRAEAFILRDLGMSSLLMLPLVSARTGRALGLIEVYDVRLRQFDADDVAAAQRMVEAASQRLEQLTAAGVEIDTHGNEAVPIHRPVRGGRPAEAGDQPVSGLG